MGAQPSRSVEAKPIQSTPGNSSGFIGRMKRPPVQPLTGTIGTANPDTAVPPTGTANLPDVKPITSTARMSDFFVARNMRGV